MSRVLLVSFDAVSDGDVDRLLSYKNFSALAKRGCLVREVESTFVSNTYPIHTSVVTGCHPDIHGINENLLPEPGNPKPDWNWYADKIKVPTIYTAAYDKGLKVASVMWPVTGGSSAIKYHVPEIFGHSALGQLKASLGAGSKWLQLVVAAKYLKTLKNPTDQPQLDNFSTAAMIHILRKKRPDLMMLHLTDVDTHKHNFGIHSPEVEEALERLDTRLGLVLDALGSLDDTVVIVFSDHSQLDVGHTVDPNRWLDNLGLSTRTKEGNIGTYRIWIQCAGGTAFAIPKDPEDLEAISLAREAVEKREGFGRFLTPQELSVAGFSHASFGIEAAVGFEFSEYETGHKANHGYSLLQPEYKVFYLVAGAGVSQDKLMKGGSLLNIAPLISEIMELELDTCQGLMDDTILIKEGDYPYEEDDEN